MKDDRRKEIYCFTDEIWPNTASEEQSDWMYISSVMLEKKKFERITDELLNARYMTGEWKDNTADSWQDVDQTSKWFPKNNEIVKFSDIEGSANKREIAKRWFETLQDQEILNELKMKILAVNNARMEYENFGEDGEDRENRVYSRLYRSQLLGGSRYFFGKSEVKKTIEINHDVRPRDQDDFEKIVGAFDASDMSIKRIDYIDDDHREASEEFKLRRSTLIQFCDLIAGCASKAFNNERLGPDRKILVEAFCKMIEDSRPYREREKRILDVSSFPEENIPEEGYFEGSRNSMSEKIYQRDIKRNSNKIRKVKKLTAFT